MKLIAIKNTQVGCWLATVSLLVLGLCKPDILKETRESYLGLLECLSVAAIGLSQYIENKKEKFSAANVVALGYITNCIKPVVDEQVKIFNNSGGETRPKDIYIFVPDTIEAVEDQSVNLLLSAEHLICQKVMVPVSTRNRTNVDIGKIELADKSGYYYFDVPNTITSLKKVVEYKLEKKGNTFSDAKRNKLEKEYVAIFKEEMSALIGKYGMENYVKVVSSISELPK